MDDPPYDSEFESGENRPLRNDTDRDETDTAPHSPKRGMSGKFKRHSKAAQKAWAEQSLFVPSRLMRTKRLLLAALRVWELKRGIRD